MDEKEDVSEFIQNGLGAWRERAASFRRISAQLRTEDVKESDPLLSHEEKADIGNHSHSNGSTRNGTDMDREFFASLAQAPPSALIHVIIEYHRQLVESGQKDTADGIVKSLDAIVKPLSIVSGLQQELQGIDLLLKDGLFKFLMKVNPYLPVLRSQVIRFKDLNYTVKRVIPEGFETLGTKAVDIARGPLRKAAKIADVDVLKGVTGYIMPGSFTLVIGPPGCGKSSLHRVLAGRVPPSKGTTLSGSVTYNGKAAQEVVVQRLVGVVDSSDFHLPFLTVKETLEVARDFTQFWTYKNYGPEMKELMGELLEQGHDPKLEMTLSMAGLKRVSQRIAGSPAIPSITADERHRLSVGEVLSGTYAVYSFDELNSGTDEKVTYDLILAVLIFARIRMASCLMSLVQPSPECFELFDRVILLDRGRVMFQGHRHDILPYFASLGYVKPASVETCEFLQEVTTEQGVAYLQPGFSHLDKDGFANAFESSELYRHILSVVDSPDLTLEISAQAFKPLGLRLNPQNVIQELSYGSALGQVSLTKTAPLQEGDRIVSVTSQHQLSQPVTNESSERTMALMENGPDPILLHATRPFVEPESEAAAQFDREFIHGIWYEMWHLTQRQILLQWRNKFSLYARLAQILILSLYTATIFFRMPTDTNQLNAGLRRGVGFSSLITNTLLNLGQFPTLMEERNVFYKQHAARFYRPFSYWFSLFAGGAVYSLFEATIWTVIVYFVSGLTTADGGWHFWVYYLIVSLITLQGAAMVRCIAFLAPDLGVASAISGVFIALFILFAGFVASRFKIPGYWKWMYFIDPLQWGITAILINEFNSSTWGTLCVAEYFETFPQCRGLVGQTLGHAYLVKGQFLTEDWWIAVAVTALIGWIAIWNLLAYRFILSVRHVPPEDEGSLPSQELVHRDESTVFRAEDAEFLAEAENRRNQNLVIPFVPVTISWHDLSYSIFIPQLQQPRVVIQDISGWAKPGEMVAFLGLSGAGKSTLLDSLAGRYIDPDNLHGEILINGSPKRHATFSRIVGFVDRQDAYWPYTTVREALLFNAAMRLGSSVTPDERHRFVDEVLELMELKRIEHRLVVSLGSRLQQEQARRVTIAIELAGNPSLLILDDPTTRMDSREALHLLVCLRNVAAGGRTVLASLHRPTLRQASLFDRVQILKRGGECVYFGPVGPACSAIKDYFESIPGVPLSDPNVNPINYALSVIGDGIGDAKVVRRDFAFEYRVSSLALSNFEALEGIRRSKGSPEAQLTAAGYGAGYLLQGKETILRLQRQYWRNLHYSFGRFMSAILLGLIVGSVFWQGDITTNPGSSARSGQIFISLILFGVANAGGVLPQINTAWSAYRRERSLNLYSTVWYNISWGLAEIPYLAMVTLIFSSISFGMSGLGTSSVGQFFQLWFIFFEFVLAITFLAMLLAVAVSFPPLASVVVPILISIIVPTGGLVLLKQKTSSEYIWVYWINPLQFALNSMTSVAFFCDTQSELCLNFGKNLQCATLPASCPLCPCPRLSDAGNVFVWTQMQGSRSLDHSRIDTDMMALALYSVLFRFLSFLALRFLKHHQRT